MLHSIPKILIGAGSPQEGRTMNRKPIKPKAGIFKNRSAFVGLFKAYCAGQKFMVSSNIPRPALDQRSNLLHPQNL